MGRNADFSKATKEIIAGRAGYRCSYPGCNRTTIGPGLNSESIDNTGTAAHIFSSSDAGPRGDGGLSIEQRKAPENGIWLCYQHGKLIDNNRGERNPTHELKAWKDLHEARIDYEHRGLPVPFGWLYSVKFGENPIIAVDSRINLSKATLFIGKNGTGKTSVCEWLAAAAGQVNNIERWLQPKGLLQNPIAFEIDYADPVPHKFGVKSDGLTITYQRDGISCNNMSPFLTVLYIKDKNWPRRLLSDTAILAYFLDIHPYFVPRILNHIEACGINLINSISIEDYIPNEDYDPDKYDDDLNLAKTVRVNMEASSPLLSVRSLSGGEIGRLIASCAIALADLSARNGPTLLILEVGGKNLDDENLSRFTEIPLMPRFSFQTIFVSAREYPKVDWTGWSIVSFAGNQPQVRFKQELSSNT